jgi:peptidyl-prolyl cis-trans isomerase C
MKHALTLFSLVLLLLLAACGQEDTPAPLPTQASAAAPPAAPGETAAPTIEPTATAVPPTPTPVIPRAATVNGEPLYLSVYEQELARYEQAQAQSTFPPDPEYRRLVLDALIESLLIRQAAAAAGIAVSPEAVDAQLAELRAAIGSDDDFNAWLAANQWTEAEFREALANEMVTGEMRDRVTASVPRVAEQVNARYLQVDNAALAQELRQRAVAGDDFAFLARQNSLDRITGENGGLLGFFARGSLLLPQVEEAAFALQPGEISEVIAVTDPNGLQTFYIVQVIERDPQRTLEADMQYVLLQRAFAEWLADLRQQAEIIIEVNVNS